MQYFDYINKLKPIGYSLSFLILVACGGDSSEQKTTPAPNAPPNIIIEAPLNNATYSEADVFTLLATANDNEDGDISSQIEWSSDIDGRLGVGTNFNTQLSIGKHSIRASVTDSGGSNADTSTIISIVSASGTAKISWTPPNQNTDETELTDLLGYKVYFGTSETNLNQYRATEDANGTELNLSGLNNNTTYYFAVVAFNNFYVESEPSNISSKIITD
jgi:hypothetical protein